MRATPALVVVVLLVLAPSLAVATPDAPTGDGPLTSGSEVAFSAESDETDGDSTSDSDSESTDSSTDSSSDSESDSESTSSTDTTDSDSTSDTDSSEDADSTETETENEANENETTETESVETEATTETDASDPETEAEEETESESESVEETESESESAEETEWESESAEEAGGEVETGTERTGVVETEDETDEGPETETDDGEDDEDDGSERDDERTESAAAAAASDDDDDGADGADGDSGDGADGDSGDGAGNSDDSADGDSTGLGPESAGAGVAVGAGALAAGAVARRVAFSGSTGTASAATSVASTTVTTAPRGLAQVVLSSLSGAVDRVQTLLTDWAERIFAAAGYTKWAGDEPLDHDTRAELYDHIQAEPGTHLSAFDEAPAVDASLGTVRYHLKILEREGLVTSEKVQGKRRYYPIGSSPNALDVALEGDSTRAILAALVSSPDSVSGLAERIDRDPSTVSHHLSRLEAEGLIERERDGQAMTNRLTPGVETILTQGPFAEAGPDADRTAADD